jgi:hypothetical protein
MGWGCFTEIARNRASPFSGLPKKNRRIGVGLTVHVHAVKAVTKVTSERAGVMMVYEKQSSRTNANLPKDPTGREGRIGTPPRSGIIGALLFVLLAGNSAFADFLITPMIMGRQVQPGRRVTLQFRIENISGDTSENVSLRVADLTQDRDGQWMEVPQDDGVDRSGLRSCREWITLPISNVPLNPWAFAPVALEVVIPPQTRGYYFAALIAETEPRETEIDGLATLFTVQYVVPIILEVQSGTLRHDVKLTDVNIRYIPPTVEVPMAAVEASMDISNTGGSYSRLQGHVRIFQELRGRWQQIAETMVPDMGIIPGVQLHLRKDLGLLLSSGNYRLEGYLYVDGRQGNAIRKDIEFKGDPTAVAGRGFVPIDVDKEDLFIDVIPGASRQSWIRVTNGSEDTIEIHAELVAPGHMIGFQNPLGVRGDDLVFTDWATVQPERFTLRRYGGRNLGVNVRMPNLGTSYANYYATLRLTATYQDGSPAGTKEIRVCLNNSATTAAHAQHHIGGTQITLTEAGPSRYFATAMFLNGGVTHVQPKCRGVLTEAGGGIYKQFLMSSEAYGQRGILVPFESRSFTGVLDVSDVLPNIYRLTAVLEFAGAQVQHQTVIRVREENGQRIAEPVGFDQIEGGRQVIPLL